MTENDVRNGWVVLRTLAFQALSLPPLPLLSEDATSEVPDADTGQQIMVDAGPAALLACETIATVDRLRMDAEDLRAGRAGLRAEVARLEARIRELLNRNEVLEAGRRTESVRNAVQRAHPGGTLVEWYVNGDHPRDGFDSRDHDHEGDVVRRFRHPGVEGTATCPVCHHAVNDHGWIEPDDDDGDPTRSGQTVCPGDTVTEHAPYQVFRRGTVAPSCIVM